MILLSPGKPHKRHKLKLQPVRSRRGTTQHQDPVRPLLARQPNAKHHFKFIGNRFKKSLDYQQEQQQQEQQQQEVGTLEQQLQQQIESDQYVGEQRSAVTGAGQGEN